MTSSTTVAGDAVSPSPSMLDLIRLSPRRLFPPGGIDLYRQIALLSGMDERSEVLDVACGTGVALEYFVREFGVEGSGVDADPKLISQAEERNREVGLGDRLQYQQAPADVLPYRNEVFDVAIGELGLGRGGDVACAVHELVRVAKPGGFVALLQLVWKAPVDPGRQAVLAAHLGTAPRMVVEWKRLLREAGVEDVHTEDWSDPATSFRAAPAKPFPDFAELFSLPEKVGILRRAWRHWGWHGVRTAILRERAVHDLLTRERILGLAFLRGRKRVHVDAGPRAPAGTRDRDGSREGEGRAPSEEASSSTRVVQGAREERGDEDVQGLPLFGAGRTDASARRG